MSVRRAGLLAVVLSVGALAPYAFADSYVPNTPKTQEYLQCSGTTKEQFTNEVTGDEVPTWSEKAPASVTTGAGCGKLDDGVFSGAAFQTPYQLGFSGTYNGNVDTLTVTLHSLRVASGRQSNAPVTLNVRLGIDGTSMFGVTTKTGATGTNFTIPADASVQVTPVPTGSTGVVTSYTFSVTGLNLLTKQDDTEHTFQFDIAAVGLGAETWLWGAAEAPTGVVLNPGSTAKAVLTANPRDTRQTF